MAHPSVEPPEEPAPSLKTLVAAGNALLQPPSPLPASPPELLARLRTSSARLPLSWRSTHSEWAEDTELEQVGDDDSSNAVRRKIRRDDLVMIVAKRSLSLLVGMQGWLEKECWPEGLRPGLKPSDYMLGGTDTKLVQLLIAHTVSSLLLQLSITYEAHLKNNNGHQTAKELSSALTSTLQLLAAPRVPPQLSGPSSIPRMPYTTITTMLHAKHLANILLSCILLAYTPTAEPAVHQKLRQQYMQTLNNINPTNTLVALGATLQILLSGQKEKSPVRGWVRPWPSYVLQIVKSTMSQQILKPGGPRALIAYMFTDPTSSVPDERRLDMITKTLLAFPKGQTAEKHIPRLLDDLLALIVQFDKPPPETFVHAAAYTIYKLWEKSREITENWLKGIISYPGMPSNPAESSAPILDSVAAQKTLLALKSLIIYAPPSAADYFSVLLRPNLHPVFALGTYRSLLITTDDVKAIKGRGKAKSRPSSAATGASMLVVMLDTWLRVASKECAVEALWEIVMGESPWKRSIEKEYVIRWAGPAGNEYAEVKPMNDADVVLPSRESSEKFGLLPGLKIDPEPNMFVALLSSMERPEVTSEIFLKLLNQWRAVHNSKSGPKLLAVQFLRIVSRILEDFGAKLLTSPEHLLLFVEGTLFDAINEGEEQPKVQMVDEAVAKDEKMLDEEEIDQLSPVDISLRLMLAILASLNPTKETNRILLPITAHVKRLATESPSTEIKSLAKEVVEKIEQSQLATTAPAQTPDKRFDEALDLLNDPILPVRAHGLAMLSELLKDPDCDYNRKRMILSQFKKALWNEDSYIYLQAGKHLAGAVYLLGPEIFKGVWVLYLEAVEETRSGTDAENVDRALRVGETLDMIIAALGKAFSIHADTVVPALMSTYANSKLVTIVRASALAILASCVTADYLSLFPWARDLFSGVVDLLQVESVRDSPFKPIIIQPEIKPAKPKVVLIEDEEPEIDDETLVEDTPLPEPRTIDGDPTNSEDGKHPALRRSAVAFLDILFDQLLTIATDHHVETNPAPNGIQFREPAPPCTTSLDLKAMLGFDTPLIQTAITPLWYIAETDIDETTRVQAITAASSASALIDLMPFTTP